MQFASKLKILANEATYKQLVVIFSQMKKEYEEAKRTLEQREKDRQRRAGAKNLREERQLDAEIAHEDYKEAKHKQETDAALMREFREQMIEMEKTIRSLTNKVDQTQKVEKYLQHCTSYLEQIRLAMLSQQHLFKSIQTQITSKFTRNIKAFCIHSVSSLEGEDHKAVETLYSTLHQQIFEIGAQIINIGSYSRVWSVIDKKYISAQLTEATSKVVSGTFELPNFAALQEKLDEKKREATALVKTELKCIEDELAVKIEPYCKDFILPLQIEGKKD